MATMTTNRPVIEERPELIEEPVQPHVTGRYAGWPSTTSGILSILSGALGIILGVGALFGTNILSLIGITGTVDTAALFAGGGVAILLGIIAVIGGGLAIRKRAWGMSLAAAIISVILMPLFGVLSLIFITIGKRDFELNKVGRGYERTRFGMPVWRRSERRVEREERVSYEKGYPKVSASKLALYLKGIDFPANKDEILRCAKSNSAPEEVMQYLHDLPEREYHFPTDVEEEFGKMR